MSAEIIQLDEYRSQDGLECDLETALDVACRDLSEIVQHWGSETSRLRAQECLAMLSQVLRG